MAVLSMFYAAQEETPNTIAFPELCKRVRFRKSSCRRCVEICPENVITLEPGPCINRGCSDCGLCERVCPTEAFGNPVCTDLDLLSRASSFPEKGRLVIHCERAENESKCSFPVPCLGSVSENVVLGLVVLGFKEIRFIRGGCFDCPRKSGEELFFNSITAARALLESLGMENSCLNFMEKGKGQEGSLSRREMLAEISSVVKGDTLSYMGGQNKGLARPSETETGRRSSPKRRLLWKLLDMRAQKGLKIMKHGPEFPWGEIRVNEEACTGCGICLSLCPTGAISRRSEDSCQVLYFNSSLCINCSLCKEACPKNAIGFEVNLRLPDILEDEARVVARLECIPCVVCGEVITAEKTHLCLSCQKQRVRSFHVSA